MWIGDAVDGPLEARELGEGKIVIGETDGLSKVKLCVATACQAMVEELVNGTEGVRIGIQEAKGSLIQIEQLKIRPLLRRDERVEVAGSSLLQSAAGVEHCGVLHDVV